MRKSQFVLAVFLLLVSGVPTARAQSNNDARTEVAVVLEGDRDNSDTELLDEANKCFAAFAPSTDVERIIPECIRNLIQLTRDQGFLRSKVEVVDKQTTESGLKLTMRVEEGNRYRLGHVDIKGNKLFTTEHLLGMLNIKTGEVVNGGALIKWLGDDVKSAYNDAGHVQYDFIIEPEFSTTANEEEDGIANLNVEIDEGLRFTVRRIEIAGYARTHDSVIRQALSLQAGDTYSHRLLERSVSSLNDLGLFEKVDVDRDVSLERVGESELLDVTIKLKELEQ